jgi:hypothetical protein
MPLKGGKLVIQDAVPEARCAETVPFTVTASRELDDCSRVISQRPFSISPSCLI